MAFSSMNYLCKQLLSLRMATMLFASIPLSPNQKTNTFPSPTSMRLTTYSSSLHSSFSSLFPITTALENSPTPNNAEGSSDKRFSHTTTKQKRNTENMPTTHHCCKASLCNCRKGKGTDGKPICTKHQTNCREIRPDGTVCKKKRQKDEVCARRRV